MACARGYMVRREVRRSREDFEDIVKEIEGDLTHLEWRETWIIPTPHFTDTDGPITQPACRPPKPGFNTRAHPLSSSSTSPEEEAHQDLFENTEAERDESQAKGQRSTKKDCFLGSSIREEGQRQTTEGGKDGGVMESTGDSTPVWSSVELGMNCGDSCRGTQQYLSVQEVPRTPEALSLHRNTLTMELLWLQQAIDSRKKYLSLKNRLSIS
ncbi:IQ domain-containing protein C isoform X2 [Notolabrus celidotus]|uniref:IQ domain-containing protein C isoform X2 n=1 Tax=Notolabrus celidotus TaxID=1203425 RepID=UPI0014901660|nr:IQ domain-containing protein C isoform X2 [Notolabrus celidotus]